ncbi:flagellar FliJ family protein [Caulobacter segnis]|uniref:flagellar FliJ family protein n=1 Tax=Caulobacter segnis TaxID=88688 RepID=UPI00241004E4|nr:flagellar FliJ family protein [Caulobacter segnis]MDG2520887.1 flagellar FliJ family protein [Caulobacter segnis]
MTKWAASLIRIANYEVESLQKRLGEISARRQDAEIRLAMLDAEGEAEMLRAQADATAGWYMVGYTQGLSVRKAEIQAQIDSIKVEESGARDALSRAFEELKKYEQVAESAKLARQKKADAIETAQMDEMGLRKTGTR